MKLRWAVGIAMGLVTLGAGYYGCSWANTRIWWPSDIQRRLVGSVPLTRADLVDVDLHSTGFGEGRFVWTYSAANLGPGERDRICPPGLPRDTASFSRKIEEGVDISLACKGDRVILEEWWS